VTKAQLVDALADRVGLTKKTAAESVNTTLRLIMDAVAKGGTVVLTGFGTFKLRSRAARKGRNPQTGEVIDISARRVPGFTAGKAFKRTVR
jgi:DNA-binding protein HU-beta